MMIVLTRSASRTASCALISSSISSLTFAPPRSFINKVTGSFQESARISRLKGQSLQQQQGSKAISPKMNEHFMSTSSNNQHDVEDHHLSSSRGRNAVNYLPDYLTDARSVTKFHPSTAPDGALQLSVAENQMLEDLLIPALTHFSSSGTETESISSAADGLFRADQIYYQSTHGRSGLRNAMSSYIQRLCKIPSSMSLDNEKLVLGAGCNAVLENLCFCLAEPGDGVLLPTPYYAAFEFDLVARAGLKIIPVNSMNFHDEFGESTSPIQSSVYYPNRKSLDAAYQISKDSGAEPKILLLSHPNNPLGICYPPDVVKECIDWARDRKVHLISDEIYAGSVYKNTKLDGKDTFQSALTLAADYQPSSTGLGKGLNIGPYIHFVYSLSKDFALSGLRVGAAYSENEAIQIPMQKLNDLCQISSQTQLTVERMLSSPPNGNLKSTNMLWTDFFMPQNQNRIRLRCERLQNCLDDSGISYLESDSGLFVWMDMRTFLPPREKESEIETQNSMDKRERQLYLELLHQYGLLFTPGRSMRNELPGFFRCVFTAASDVEFDLALKRIKAFVTDKTNT